MGPDRKTEGQSALPGFREVTRQNLLEVDGPDYDGTLVLTSNGRLKKMSEVRLPKEPIAPKPIPGYSGDNSSED